MTREIRHLESKCLTLNTELGERMVMTEEMTGKVHNYEQLRTKLEKLEKEYSHVNTDRLLRLAQLEQLTEEKAEAERNMNEQIQKAELLKMDKIYLSKELE